MGFLKKAFSWLASGPNAAQKVLDAGISGIDKIWYTDEEKADARQKLTDDWIKLQPILQQETTVRSVTRRMLALLFCISYILILFAGVLLLLMSVNEKAVLLFDVADGKLGWIVASVIVFYFGPTMIGRAFENYRASQKQAESVGGGGKD